ncbi:MAG TPA: glutathione S-transferase family protein [Kofleriaceae bacterium]|nr:glutathione S-transferase family protein [Kofleriaceae bacterium]
MSTMKVSAFRWVPPFAQGLVRDLRVRWALEEAGLPYQQHLIGPADQKAKAYRELQPFGQVPSLESDGLVIFESGAIVMHIAEKSDALMPSGADARARVRTWMFAALNTVEPPIMMLSVMELRPGGVPDGAEPVREDIMKMIRIRLDSLVDFLGEREHLVEDRFTAADLLMTTVLRILRTTDLVDERPTLEAYRVRSEARPAFQKALAAQMANFEANSPPPRQAPA